MTEALEQIHPWLPAVGGLAALFLVAVAAHFATRFGLTRLVHAFARRTRATWDDALAEEKTFARIAQIVPAMIVYWGIRFVPDVPEAPERLVGNLAMAWIVIFVIAAVLMVAALIDKSPALLLTGFGAMTAVLLLVFRDTILGLVASVQLTAQDMVRVGDWIEMPRYDADGDVIDVALHTVTVQNWDKTITTIPTHALISESFKNWRGMSESGGRRIKRSLFIDLASIRFLTTEEAARFRRFALLRDYIRQKDAELADWNSRVPGDAQEAVNLRRLTNVGTFRAYVFNYLKNHPGIHQGMTLMVRQLAPRAEGLPLEIYAFTNTTAWTEYEGIQGDIFDHVLAIAGEFGLRVFQSPSGHDVRRALSAEASA